MQSVLCAVNHGLYSPWLDILHRGQEKTWLLSPLPDNVEVVHIHGTPVNKLLFKIDRAHEHIRWSTRHGHRLLKFIDNMTLLPWMSFIPEINLSEILITKHKALHVHFPDVYLTHRWKALSLMKYFLTETDHDYLLSTTTSSYVNVVKLSTIVQSLNYRDLYYGALPYKGARFVSGSNRLLSRETVTKVMNSMSLWKPGIIEDVALGQLLEKVGIRPTFIPIINISSIQELYDLDVKTFQSNYHFRFKSGNDKNRNDVSIMRAFHSRFGNVG